MSRVSHRRRSFAGLAAAASLLLVGACGTNFEAQTNQDYQADAGSNERAEGVDLMNVLAVENTDGTATVSAGLINKSGDVETLTGVSGTDREGNEIDVTLADPVDLPTNKLVQLGQEPEVVISGDEVSAGYYATLSLEFENLAPVEIEVPVIDRGDEGTYDSVAEAPETGSKNSNRNQGEQQSDNG